MMGHLSMIVGAIALAVGLRHLWQTTRPATVLSFFLVPPLLLLMTAIAIVVMGPHGHMVSHLEGWFCYGLAWSFIVAAIVIWGHLAGQTWQARQRAGICQQQRVHGYTASIVDSAQLFSAQVGLWQPHLIVSQGLIDRLSAAKLTAVLTHEAAHVHYRDTFWFFWLAGLRRLTVWLPYSETLWQELLLLRELRADRWATQFVDRLVLAEALVEVIAAPLAADTCAAFSCAVPSRLSRRIDALLVEPTAAPQFDPGPLQWTEMCLSLAPLLTIPFHH